jgi:sn-glycerol 3-phosphate transport system permease protein
LDGGGRAASRRAGRYRHIDAAGPFGLRNFQEAWQSGNFPLWYLNTIIVCGGILAVQLVTATAAGYAFARLTFSGRDILFALFLLQLLLVPSLLIVPNLQTLVSLRLYDTLLAIMAPYFASAFGTFLMRQTFRTIPRDYEEAAMLEGATIPALIRHVLVPLARPGLAAFAIVSVMAHWNEFLWPLMAVSSPSNHRRWKIRNSRSSGPATRNVPAATMPHAEPASAPEAKAPRRFLPATPA